jgi:hypothetical protein
MLGEPLFLFSRRGSITMGILDYLNRTFGESSDLPIQVADDLSLYVEEKRTPNQASSHRPYQGLIGDSMEDDSD